MTAALWTSLATIVAVWAVTVLSLGPNFFMTVLAASRQSPRLGVMVSAGIALGTTIWATAGLLFQSAAWLYQAVKLAGGAYLVYLGLRTTLSARDDKRPRLPPAKPLTARGAVLRGPIVDLSNPVFFASLFAIAVLPEAPLRPSPTSPGRSSSPSACDWRAEDEARSSARLGFGCKAGDRARQPVGQRSGQCFGEDAGQGAVVPACAFGAALEAPPKRVAQKQVVREDGLGVVSLVGQGHQLGTRRLAWQGDEVGFLAVPPGRLGRAPGVGAVRNDPGNLIAEGCPDLGKGRGTALVLRRVVQQGSDCLVLIAAVLDHQGGDAHEMGDVRSRGALAKLVAVQPVREPESLVEAICQHGDESPRRSTSSWKATRGPHGVFGPEGRPLPSARRHRQARPRSFCIPCSAAGADFGHTAVSIATG